MRREKIVDTSLFARISSSFLQRNNFMKKNLNNGCCWFNKTTSPMKKKISKEARRWEQPPSSFPPLHFPLQLPQQEQLNKNITPTCLMAKANKVTSQTKSIIPLKVYIVFFY
jgi:hypothetical protein